MAVWSYLPSYRWGITVKQNLERGVRAAPKAEASRSQCSWPDSRGPDGLLRRPARGPDDAHPIHEAVQLAERVAFGDLTARGRPKSALGRGRPAGPARRETMTGDLRSLIGRIKPKSSIPLRLPRRRWPPPDSKSRPSRRSPSTRRSPRPWGDLRHRPELLETMAEVNESPTTRQAGRRGSRPRRDGPDHEATGPFDRLIGSKLAVIREKAANINVAVTTITKVADQTNLLSINAAIEAEKAGEYGLGFLVVAREIRRLADQTAVATLDIEQIVRDMQVRLGGRYGDGQVQRQVRLGSARSLDQRADQLIIDDVQALLQRFHRSTRGCGSSPMAPSRSTRP